MLHIRHVDAAKYIQEKNTCVVHWRAVKEVSLSSTVAEETILVIE